MRTEDKIIFNEIEDAIEESVFDKAEIIATFVYDEKEGLRLVGIKIKTLAQGGDMIEN